MQTLGFSPCKHLCQLNGGGGMMFLYSSWKLRARWTVLAGFCWLYLSRLGEVSWAFLLSLPFHLFLHVDRTLLYLVWCPVRSPFRLFSDCKPRVTGRPNGIFHANEVGLVGRVEMLKESLVCPRPVWDTGIGSESWLHQQLVLMPSHALLGLHVPQFPNL